MSSEVLFPPSQPIQRAMNYEVLHSKSILPLYSICIVSSEYSNGTTKLNNVYCANCIDSAMFQEIQELYHEWQQEGGFQFPIESIARRIPFMDRVLCWFTYKNGIQYTCYVSKEGCDPISSE